MKRLSISSFICASVLALGVTGAAQADAGDSPVLKRIQENKVINVGHRETSIPFAYMDDNGKPIGYSIKTSRYALCPSQAKPVLL